MTLADSLAVLKAAINTALGTIDGKLRNKAEKSEIYTRTEIDDALEEKADSTSVYTRTSIDDALAGKADKTATLTPEQVDARIQAIVGSAPESLDTLLELAEALGNDPEFAATITAELAKKAAKADVYTKTAADSRFQAAGDYSTNAKVDDLETRVAAGFNTLAQTFRDGAATINNAGA